jgi:hypothetical protein
MPGILTNHQDDIQLYHKGLPLVWDGECKDNEENCAECILDLSPAECRQSSFDTSQL